ncbi:putative protein C23C11,01 OS=Schizosaccharomyces pombe (strain 972 / ATCC 24843) GN=SPAC23C11.01 PE=4 SV=1 [Rhizoctonia solani AG-1 IB]|uniref:ICE2 domain-containing protein n=1 Tax=Thanatephorus cucumeris (strain AG1-IB / isolate 7/3/14) TaxID=1108050 RepID=A0A0B7FNY1_THACB|nr:putative protein C23C11,01 OS=Schizosaccharomyces pombe (strain 972 / ATCC 24843) GN=SPAC23C11.01 PE=4 SV=1 [Rhizoctonia solani AG-1 IB]
MFGDAGLPCGIHPTTRAGPTLHHILRFAPYCAGPRCTFHLVCTGVRSEPLEKFNMATPWILLSAITNTARLSTVLQILLFLPLTLSTLSTPAFLVCSLGLTLHALVHGTMHLLMPWLSPMLSFMQLPMHPVVLLTTFNLFSTPRQSLLTASSWWGKCLRWSSPLFVGMEGMASLLVIQFTGRKGKEVAEQGESAQFGLLVGAAAAYVAASWWLVVTYPVVAVTPLSSTLVGAAVTTLVFLTLIGFAVRRTNVIETAGLALYVAYNIWLCSETGDSDGYGEGWIHISSTYAPLAANIMPHLQTLVNFIRHTLPKPLLVSLLYRLSVLHLASRILPLIGGDSWAGEAGVDDGWDERPSSRVTTALLTYRQTIFVTVYSHLLLLDHTSQVWWRWTNIFFTLAAWSVEILLTGEDDDLGVKWKVD